MSVCACADLDVGVGSGGMARRCMGAELVRTNTLQSYTLGAYVVHVRTHLPAGGGGDS
jgi:hypothetical protein